MGARLSWANLVLGVLAASVSAILIRYASDAHPLALSFWRCAVGAVLLAPLSLRGVHAMQRRDYVAPVAAGAFLAVHFATWITSLELTTVALSVLLVTTSPVFVALAARFLFKEQFTRAVWFGIALTLAGTAAIAGVDLHGATLAGNVLALIGGITAAGYAMAGQVARQRLGNIEYATVTYAVAAVLLVPALFVGDVELGGYAGTTWAAIAALIVGPQLLGHTLINYALRDIGATTVSVAIMAEPVIATLLALALFGEVPPVLTYPGAVAILAGIYLVSKYKTPPAVVVE